MTTILAIDLGKFNSVRSPKLSVTNAAQSSNVIPAAEPPVRPALRRRRDSATLTMKRDDVK